MEKLQIAWTWWNYCGYDIAWDPFTYLPFTLLNLLRNVLTMQIQKWLVTHISSLVKCFKFYYCNNWKTAFTLMTVRHEISQSYLYNNTKSKINSFWKYYTTSQFDSINFWYLLNQEIPAQLFVLHHTLYLNSSKILLSI